LIPVNLFFPILEVKHTVFLSFILSIINAYCVILAGWASNSKYSFLGGMRSAAQMISYDVYFGLLLIPIFFFTESLNLLDIVQFQENFWFGLVFLPSCILFFITMLAETNRAPFDLPEAEAELVAGFNVEYSGLVFSLFFLAEYNNIFISCSYIVTFFGGGFYFLGYASEIIFYLKVIVMVFIFIFVRGILPRFRYDQLMAIGWKKFLPLSIGFILFYSFIINLTGNYV